MPRVVRFLRSRRLAIVLILACAGWAVIGTLVPLDPSSADAARWAASHPIAERLVVSLGLARPFSWPPFLALVALLAASMAACSLDRTRWAMSRIRESAGISERLIDRLSGRPALHVDDLSASEAMESAKGVLESLGLRVRATTRALEGRSGRFGPLGSPVFHWALTLLIAVVVAGQLTRSEGLMGVPVGDSLMDVPSEYGRYEEGRLHSSATPPYEVAVIRISRDAVRNGVEVGTIPTVQLRRGGAVIQESEVYPNHPLRSGATMIHQLADGYVGLLEYRTSSGETSTMRVYFDYAENGKLAPGSIEVADTEGALTRVVLEPVASYEVPGATPGSRYVRVKTGGLRSRESTTLTDGGSLGVGDGTLTIRRLAPYARLSVVHDWSVYLIYALFVILVAGLTVAILLPERRVWILISAEGASGVDVRWIAHHQRKDPTFATLVHDSLSELSPVGSDEQERR